MLSSALFTGLSKNECMEIAACARTRSFQRDELLFMQGQTVRQMVLLQTGSVKLTQLSPNGSEVILWMNGSGEPVGVPAGCSTDCHSCSARAMEHCHALIWEHAKLQDLLVKYPQLARNISQILSNRLGELQERFREVATQKVAQRLALTLLRLARHVGKPSGGGIEISLTREELAQMTGTTLFTISRQLSRWAEERVVLPRREAVVVLNQARLLEISNEDD